MKAIVCFVILGMISTVAGAVPQTPTRRAMSNQMVDTGRVTASNGTFGRLASIQQINHGGSLVVTEDPVEEEKDMREKEKTACLNNNIGIGNTFVWASKYSNTTNYASMVEDVENPENNVCFVRVELKSDDNRINVSDIAAVYYPMGTTITCGAWADEDKIKDRILAAKKSGRTWGTVAAVVGSAGVGVGAMELFGNELIGGKVEGQKNEKLSKTELMRSQLLVLKKEDKAQYDSFIASLRQLQQACEDKSWNTSPKSQEVSENCAAYDYKALLSDLN